MFNHKINKKSGFSLIEILIVVAIVSLLTIIALTAKRFQIKKAKDSKIKEDLNRIQTALENYYSDNDCYPDTNPLQNCGGNDLNPYLNSIPCSPYGTPYCYIPEDGTTCPQNFRVLSNLQNPHDPKIEELGCSGTESCGYETECSSQIPGTDEYNYGVSSTNVTIANPALPQPSITPSPYSTPDLTGTYACSPAGICNIYADPASSGCPTSYHTPDCNNACGNPINRCTN